MRKWMVRAAVLLGAPLLLSGCWDRHELNSLSIVVGMGFDLQGDQVRVTAQIVNPGEVAAKQTTSAYAAPVTTLTAAAPTTLEALRKLSAISPRRIYRSHLHVLVIGEELARRGISRVIDGISRHHEARSDFFILVARETTAERLLNILVPLEKIPAEKLFSMLETSAELWAPTVTMKLAELLSDLASPTKDAVLSGVRIVGPERIGESRRNMDRSRPYANMKFAGTALFREDRLVDWLDEQESEGYSYLTNHVHNSAGHVACPDGGIVALDVTRSKTVVKGRVAGGRPSVHVQVRLEANVGEVQCDIDLTRTESLRRLEVAENERLTSVMEAAIRKAQQNRADIFGFGEAIEDAHPGAWRTMRREWGEHFADLDVQIVVDTQLRRIGTTVNSEESA